MNRIPPLDLTRQYASLDADVSAAVLAVLRSGRYIGGAAVSDFETVFAEYIGTPYAVGCNSGTDALYLALRACDIGPGDEVITTPLTFIATAEVICRVGATPVFIDIDPTTFNLDPNRIAPAITPRTKAIIPVHLFGRPVDMTAVIAIAQSHNLVVLEDCAQSTGAMWAGQKVGSMGTVGCFSFFPTKNLGACGDGGAITTGDEAIAHRIRQLREHGQSERYIHTQTGLNSRLDALQATILAIKLRHLDHWNQQRQAVAQRYDTLLAQLPTITLPTAPPSGQAVWNQYTIRVADPQGDGSRRNGIQAILQDQGISSMVYYPRPLHLQPVYQHLGYRQGDLPQAEQAAAEVLSLPMFPELTPEEQEQVAYGLKAALAVHQAKP
ncbi:DegT/DnrJ/EryC1/StrS family aminotransferase [Spirulina sp. CCNP1310]|uniref:DegT/DnrJ/EryC1/StrS family aminotransferase n=1 Tax=Spirulina sp. CCNP1310 TaxID=3110249 RepID=UPI002B21DCA5|nr:DegT/DnrJ/EryC1/StrS family aminotransferase [Spirulina sp. CCNP1310]